MFTVNTYSNVRQPQVLNTINVNDWFAQIKNSEYSSTITQARNGQIDYSSTKLSLPCVTYNFKFNTYKKDSNITDGTGLLYIDIDEPSFNIKTLDTNKIYAYYRSFGGHGYSLLVKVSGLNKYNFKVSYTHIVEQLGIENLVDTNAVKASQYNVLSYDENLFINEDSYVFTAPYVENIAPLLNVIEKKEGIYTTEGGKIRFNNLDEVETGENDYIVDWEGIEYVNCFIPMMKIKSGNRNSFLLSYTNNLVWLNQHLPEQKIYNVISKVNSAACEEPLGEEQVYSIVKGIFKYKEDCTLKPIVFRKKRKFVFNHEKQLTKKEKWRIMIDEMNSQKMNNSQQKLYQILENWDVLKDGKITQRAVYKNYPISKKTVEKYWSEFKEYVDDLNNSNIRINEFVSKEKVSEIEAIKPTLPSRDKLLSQLTVLLYRCDDENVLIDLRSYINKTDEEIFIRISAS